MNVLTIVNELSNVSPKLIGAWMSAHRSEVQHIKDVTSFLPPCSLLRQRMWHIENATMHLVSCSICGASHSNWSKHTNSYLGCSPECCKRLTQQRRDATKVERYGTTGVTETQREKSKSTSRQKYGVDHPTQSKIVQDKTIQTNLTKYGCSSHLSNDEIRQKINLTNLIKYGSHNPQSSQVVRDKTAATKAIQQELDPTRATKIRLKSIETLHSNYGEEGLKSKVILAKRRITSQSKYDVDHPMQSPLVVANQRQSMVNIYGVEHNSLIEGAADRRAAASVIKYGVDHPMKSTEVKAKRLSTNVEKYGAPAHNLRKYSEVLHLIEDTEWLKNQHLTHRKSFNQIAFELGGIDPQALIRRVKVDDPHFEPVIFSQSHAERTIACMLESLGLQVVTGSRSIIPPLELDIYIPSHKLAIEYCGLYWHSDAHNRMNSTYHKSKHDGCNKLGIRLLTIFEDEWNEKQEIVLRTLRHLVGLSDKKIYARKCLVKTTQPSHHREFLTTHHIQGDGPGSIKYGLYHDGDLVACMSFIQKQDGVYVLSRYASQNVLGGFTKLLDHFKRNNPTWREIISFSDNRWSAGKLYQQCGFTHESDVTPDYYWVRRAARYHKFAWRHTNRLKYLPNYDPSLSESENMYAHGYHKIYNCGLKKWTQLNEDLSE